MSSATAWTGNMITLLFVSLTANCSNSCGSSCKIPVPETAGCSVDSQRPRVSGTQLSCASVGDQLAIIGKVSRGMTGQEVHFIDNIWGLYRPWPPSPERSIGPIAYRRGWCNPCWLRDSAASVRRSALQSARPRPVEWLQWRYEHQAPASSNWRAMSTWPAAQAKCRGDHWRLSTAFTSALRQNSTRQYNVDVIFAIIMTTLHQYSFRPQINAVAPMLDLCTGLISKLPRDLQYSLQPSTSLSELLSLVRPMYYTQHIGLCFFPQTVKSLLYFSSAKFISEICRAHISQPNQSR